MTSHLKTNHDHHISIDGVQASLHTIDRGETFKPYTFWSPWRRTAKNGRQVISGALFRGSSRRVIKYGTVTEAQSVAAVFGTMNQAIVMTYLVLLEVINMAWNFTLKHSR